MVVSKALTLSESTLMYKFHLQLKILFNQTGISPSIWQNGILELRMLDSKLLRSLMTLMILATSIKAIKLTAMVLIPPDLYTTILLAYSR